MNFKVGDRVRWFSHSRTHEFEKFGTVVAIVPKHTSPLGLVPRGLLGQSKCHPRSQVSYVVAAGFDGVAKRLYWPVAGKLRLCSAEDVKRGLALPQRVVKLITPRDHSLWRDLPRDAISCPGCRKIFGFSQARACTKCVRCVKCCRCEEPAWVGGLVMRQRLVAALVEGGAKVPPPPETREGLSLGDLEGNTSTTPTKET